MRAVVLCAGYGTRLGGITREMPKPMLPLHGRPLLEYIICHLASHGFRDIAVNLHYRPELIQGYFGDGSRWGVRLVYSYEAELLGTAGALKRMEEFLSVEPQFLVQYGDVLTDQDLSGMSSWHEAHEAWATVLLHRRERSNSIVTIDASMRVTGFLERPTEAERLHTSSKWVNSGICVASRELLSAIPNGTPLDLPRDIFVKVVGTEKIFGYPQEGYRCAIDSPERYEQAKRELPASLLALESAIT